LNRRGAERNRDKNKIKINRTAKHAKRINKIIIKTSSYVVFLLDPEVAR